MARVLRHDYRWSLQSRRASRLDPVVDFVLRERVGHCEYFASAMALVARIRGIPARVVGGYRVAEYNPLGKNYVVRESNAHAWVEAWVEGRGWQSYDPTPDASVNALREQGFFAALIDLARARPRRAILALSALVIVVALALSLRARLGGPLPRADEPTLPNLAKLVGAIARRTRKRAPGETLLEWAHEVALPEEVALLERYSAVRWGGAPDVGAVEEDAARLARQTRSGGSGRR